MARAGRAHLSLDAIRAASANPDLRLLQLGRLLSVTAKWDASVALAVFAYKAAGPAGVALAAMLHLVHGAVSAHFAGPLARRFGPDAVGRACGITRGTALGLAAVVTLLGWPAPLVYALFVVSASASISRPIQDARLPQLARTPAELTSTNLALSVMESAGILIGPLAGAVLLHWASIGLAFAVAAGVYLVSRVLQNRIRTPALRPTSRHELGFFAELAASARVVALNPQARLVVLLFAVFGFVDGTLDVLIAVTALRELNLGESGVGTLTAVTGAGGVVGGLLVVGRLRRGRPGTDLVLGMLVSGVPLVVLGLLTSASSAFLLLALFGVGFTLVQVSVATLVQRAVPETELSHALGLYESVFVLSVGTGTMLAPLLVRELGVTGALVLSGALLPGLAAVAVRRLRSMNAHADRSLVELLNAMPIFAPLPDASIEYLAASLEPAEAAPGAVVFEQGDHGDAYYLIQSGEAEVLIDGARVRVLGAGDGFGEIALLRDVPRTATIRARGAVRLQRLRRDRFLAVVAGNPDNADAADAMIAQRLGRSGFIGR